MFIVHPYFSYARARICKPFKEPRNRFPAWRADTTTLFDVLAHQDRLAESIPWNRFRGSLNVYKFGIRMLLDYAAKCGGVVVSRDNYRDLIGVSTAPAAYLLGILEG
jgi:hypothetical protein